MAKDPLKIIGKPNPTPEERAAAEALSTETTRPAKLCRAALLEANHDVARARELLNDGKFLMMNGETDDADMMDLAQRLLREQSGAPPLPDPFAGVDFKAVQQAYADMAAHDAKADKARGTKLKDPVLGSLKWDTLWEGRVNVPPFGNMRLDVDTDREPDDIATPPGDAHRATFQAFVAAAADVYAKVARANLEYLDRVRDVYEEAMPKLAKPADVWKELSDAALVIPLQFGGGWRVELHWNCSWDEEHGHAVYIKDGEVVNVGIPGEGWPDADDE